MKLLNKNKAWKEKEKKSHQKNTTQTLHNQKGNEEEENSSHHFNNFNTFVNLEMKSETFIFSLLQY
jgi:hypothetical protein